MVVLFFAIAQNESKKTPREFVDSLKKELPTEHKKISPIDMDSLVRGLTKMPFDTMLQVSDELQKFDHDLEIYLRSLEKKIGELQEKFELTVNLKNTNYKVEEALFKFIWDENKYPFHNKTVQEILKKMIDKFNVTSKMIKEKSESYQADAEKLKQRLKSDNEAALFMKADYRDVVRNYFNKMVQTDYLTTILCFVPKNMQESFLDSYEKLADNFVLPASAERLETGSEEDKVSLFRVVVMRHKVEEFSTQARLKFKANVKEYSKEEIDNKPKEQAENDKLRAVIEKKKEALIRQSEVSYSELYSILLHVKQLRLFSETSLKYGRVSCYSSVILPVHGKEPQLVSKMIKNYRDTTDDGWYGTKEELKETEDFYPFVLIRLNVPSFI